ncbi:HlyD family secretion protein [Shewanella sp.]|uniref:HlyD family secretion protein n=1 Tax=Shewanella sp. TaxID=50422 RepID=UPI000C0E1051|nr:HlyD family secretion protein [Shewanella sp.]MBL4815966.1 HlyD family secretion protein [Shewanella sp.]MCJ8304506.1 HlyD family secretion protein [Shewanella sp.]PHQ76657.1 MAG: efflux transporter periplasmic adaptor subunit [Shewanella sp.]
MKKLLIIVLNVLIIGGALFLGYQKYQEYFNNPWTRDGQIRANVIKLAPRVSGPLVQVYIKDNQFVHKGDLLFKIDPSTYAVSLSQAEVGLERAKLSSQGKKIEFDRLQDIRAKDKGAVSHKDLIRREIAYEESKLKIKASEEQLKAARMNLGFTNIYAPVEGYVSNIDIQIGTQAVMNQPLIALVDSNSFWAFAYFRESELEQIHIGSTAMVTLMAHPDKPIEAKVESIGWGIAPKDGTVGYNLLPNVNPVFQWIRLAQRIPVRITLDELPEGVELRFGLSASIMVLGDE